MYRRNPGRASAAERDGSRGGGGYARSRPLESSSAIADIDWAESLLPLAPAPADLAAEARRLIGGVPLWVGQLAPRPWVARVFIQLMSRPVAHAPVQLCELISLVVSQDNSCRYCYSTQRAFLRMLGYRDDKITRLERDFHVADLSPAERAALDFARKVSRASPRPDRGDRTTLARFGFAPPAIAELAFTAAAIVFANRVATLLALPAEPFVAVVDRRLFRVLQPFIAWRIRPRHRAAEPLPVPNTGPGAEVVAALAGSPSARVLRTALDLAWASDAFPARTKHLLFAVVGRALGCTRAEEDARTRLADEGFTGADMDQVLAHLASPRLDAREALLVPFARETVRFSRPIVVQHRMREIAARLAPHETLDAIGLVSLANAVCRLSALLDVC